MYCYLCVELCQDIHPQPQIRGLRTWKMKENMVKNHKTLKKLKLLLCLQKKSEKIIKNAGSRRE